jgi:chromosome segregation ATPase
MTDDQYRQLVGFLGEQFAQMDRRFDQIDGRFAQIDGRFAQNEGRFARIDARFAQIDARFLQVEERIAGLAGDLESFRSEVRTEFDETKGMIRLLDRRVARLEAG